MTSNISDRQYHLDVNVNYTYQAVLIAIPALLTFYDWGYSYLTHLLSKVKAKILKFWLYFFHVLMKVVHVCTLITLGLYMYTISLDY